MAGRVASLLGTSEVHVMLRYPETDEWMLGAGTGSQLTQPLIEECRPLLNVLVERGEDVARDVLDDDLVPRDAERNVVSAMGTLRASLAIPLKVSGEVWGVLAVGDKDTGTNYSLGELRSLRKLARELSLGLYRKHLAFGFSGHPPVRGVRLSNLFPELPESIGPYRIERKLGEGGMALVYLGSREGRQVAVKVLNERARHDVKLEKRFQRECEILHRLRHPNVLAVLDFRLSPEPYLVVEYCPLGTVRDLLRERKRLSAGEAVDLIRQAVRGLSAAREMGVVHRDVNPRNLLRAEGNIVKVSDFGIAHWDRELALTTHELLGTPGYLSPELCAGQSVDWRADQYALGIMLFEVLAGRRPYGSARVVEVLVMHVNAPVPDLRVEGIQDVSDELAGVVRRMMSKAPSDRFESYDSLMEALKCFSNRPCTTWGGRGTSARTDAGGPMRASSMDLRERALLDSDAGMKAADVAAKYRVSGSWVRLLKQRRRDTGEVAPRVQRQGRRGMLEPHLHTWAALSAAHPDRTLAELKDALATPARVPTVWRAVRALGLTVTKNGPPVRTRSA